MAPIDIVLIVIVATAVVLAVIASARIIRESESFVRSAAQLAFVWVVPIIGPLVAIHLLRREPVPGSGTYSNTYAAADEGDWLRQRDATFESHSEADSGSGDAGH